MEAQKENSHSNHKLSPEERIENALVRKSLQDEMASLVITKAFEESRGGISDQIKVRTIEKRLDDIEDSLDDVDDLTIVMSEYDSQASLHETSRLDLLARKFDRLTKGAAQAELVELYGVVAVSYGEDSALLAHIAQRIEGDTEPDTEIVGDEPGTIGSASGKSPENKKTPEQERQPSLKERYDLPGGFRTEKGSVYRYSESGKTKRHKFDHTEQGDQRMGIAVFYPDIPAYRDIITRIGAEQGHMPKNKQRRGYIIEDDSKAPQGYRRVYDIARANNPQNLHFALIKNDGTIDGRFPVSIIPQKGLYVFEMGRDKRGRTIRHPGHKVTEILEKDEDVIRAWGKLAKQAKK